ncbi:MAG: reverse transcriptase domain-containing protein [Thermodesulfobacteriota bacterium]
MSAFTISYFNGTQVSVTLSDDGAQLKSKFLSLKTPQDIATLLDVPYNRLIYHLYRKPPADRYTTFTIGKNNGELRTILAPISSLKIIQRKLKQVLENAYTPKPSVHGFVLTKSILSNARMHTKQRYVFNVDLKDFFPTINFGRVRGMFMGFPYKLPKNVATVLAQICCFNNQLPQGAPTSPIVSNMICAHLDSDLQRLAKTNKSIYTRYADDIAFSTSTRSFPPSIATIDKLGQVQVGRKLNTIIVNNGFEIKPNKVWLRQKDRRQLVTGLVVNQFPNVRRKYTNQIRAMLYAYSKFGLKAANEEFLKSYDQKHRGPTKNAPRFQLVLKGKLDFLSMIRGKDDPLYLRLVNQLKSIGLLERFDSLIRSTDHQARGYEVQSLLKEVFEVYAIPVTGSFTRNKGAEQIDGAFEFDGWHYIVECRWRQEIANVRELDGLHGQVCRAGKQTMGLFLSINGWSKNVPELLKQNPEKAILLMDGEDLYIVLSAIVTLPNLLRAKLARLNLYAEPFYSAKELILKEGS